MEPLYVFTFLTTLSWACDTAGLTHGQAFPLKTFRRAGLAKPSWASVANTVVSDKRYELVMYRDGVNWLLEKYATHATLATAHHVIISISQLDTKVPRVILTRVEGACNRLCGLFHTQDVKDIFINDLSDFIKINLRVLGSQLPCRPLAETVAAAQGFWAGANMLRLYIKERRPPLIKVDQIEYAPTPFRTVGGAYEPTKVTRVQPTTRATDYCCICDEPGHYASRCPKALHERRQASSMAQVQEEIRKQVNAIVYIEVLRDFSGDETSDSEAPENDVGRSKKRVSWGPAGA